MSLTRVPRRMLDVDIADQQYVLDQIDALTTDDIEEGALHRYFTEGRARTALGVTGGLLSYDSATGILGLSSAAIVTTARTALVVTGDLSYDALTGILSYTGISVDQVQDAAASLLTSGVHDHITAVYDDANNRVNLSMIFPNSDEIVEGTTNLFYTDARARSALQSGDGIYYDVVSGAINVNPFFGYIEVPGKDPVIADTAGSSFKIVAGSGMSINTIPAQNTIVLSSSGGGAGGSADPLEILSAAMIYG